MSPDLRSTYLGLQLKSPLVASASPLTGNLDSLLALEEAGAAAVVLPSLFEEQIEHDETTVDLVLERGAQSFGEALTYFPEMDDYNTGPGAYVKRVAAAKEALSIPVIASINGVTPGGWIRYAELLQQAGADAIELNVYAVETDPYASAASVEDRTLRLVSSVHGALTVPLAVKVGPYYTAFANTAMRLADAGAAGPRPLQPLPPAGYRPRDDDRDARAAPLLERGDAAAAAMDRDPPRPCPREPCRNERRPVERRRGQAAARGRRRRDAHLGPAASRAGSARAS